MVDKRIAKTKEHLKNALVKLLEKKSLDDISIVELTTLANINRKTFYLHYKQVPLVYKEIKDDLLDKLSKVIYKYDLSIENLETFIIDFVKVVMEDKFAFHILRYTPYAFNVAEAIVVLGIELLAKKHQQNNTTKSTFTIEFYVYGGVRLLYQWIKTSNTLDINVFANKLSKLIIDGIK